MFISTATSYDEAARAADVAVLPVGSFEQHGRHLPLSTDTLIASAIAQRIAADYELFLLPPITASCSHEHSDFKGTVSISPVTLHALVNDVLRSIHRAGISGLAVINGHGGNYVLSNIVQEANVDRRTVVLYPRGPDWAEARAAAQLETDNHGDMHGGEAETSIMLAVYADVVRDDYAYADHLASDRRHLLTVGMRAYTESGVIGRPSRATAEKGHVLLDSLSQQFKHYLSQLR